MDSGAEGGYPSTALISRIANSPVRQETRQIEMLLHTTSWTIEVHNLTMRNQEGSFKLNVDIHKVEKDILLILPNPEYKKLIQCYSYLRGVFIDDDDTKAELPVPIILGTSDFLKIKTNFPARIGKNSGAHKIGTRPGCYGNQTTLPCTTTRMEGLPVYLSYFPRYYTLQRV